MSENASRPDRIDDSVVADMTDQQVVDHARGLGLADFEYPEAVAVRCAEAAFRRGLISVDERDWLVNTKPTARTAWPAGSRVRVKSVKSFLGKEGTVVGPATQAGFDVVVHFGTVGALEFRNWELEAVDA